MKAYACHLASVNVRAACPTATVYLHWPPLHRCHLLHPSSYSVSSENKNNINSFLICLIYDDNQNKPCGEQMKRSAGTEDISYLLVSKQPF